MLWLRLVHILAGVFWVGSAVFMAAIVLPAARAAGAEGGVFMERLMQQPRTRAALGAAMLLTVLSGLALYGRLSGGFARGWVTSPKGLALGLGAIATILVGARPVWWPGCSCWRWARWRSRATCERLAGVVWRPRPAWRDRAAFARRKPPPTPERQRRASRHAL